MAKRPTKPRAKPPTALVAASVTYAETATRWGSAHVVDRELVARGVVNSVYSACNMNAGACAAQPIRLYRAARGGTKSWAQKLYPGLAVKSRKRLAWLRGELKHKPGRKALALASSTDDIEEVTSHPALDLMYAPDGQMPASSWWWLLYFFNECAGRAYIYKGERVGGVPTSLYILAPQSTRIDADKQSGIVGYYYGVEGAGSEVRYAASDVVYHRFQPNPFRPLQAMSWLWSVRLQSDLEQAAIQSEIARWNNGGNPSMVFELAPELTTDQCLALESVIKAKYTGVNKAGAMMVLQNAKLNAAGHRPRDMQYIEGGQRAEEMIYRAAGIPEPMWKMNDSNRAAAGQADPQYMGQTILPRINAVAEALTEGVLSEWGDDMWFAYDNPVAEDRAAEVEEVIKLTGIGGMTVNEGRALLGYDDVGEEGDVLRYNGMPLSAQGADLEDETAKAPEGAALAPEADVQATALNGAQVESLIGLADKVAQGQLPEAAALAIAAASFPLVPQETINGIFTSLRGFTPTPPSEGLPGGGGSGPGEGDGGSGGGSAVDREDDAAGEDANSGDDRKAAVAASEVQSGEVADTSAQLRMKVDFIGDTTPNDLVVPRSRKCPCCTASSTKAATTTEADLAKFMQGWYERALGTIGPDGRPAFDAILPDLEKGIRSMMADVFAEGGNAMVDRLGGEDAFSVTSEEAVRYVNEHSGNLIRGITETVRDQVQTAVTRAVAEGRPLSEVATELRASGFAENRAAVVARTETITAYNAGQFQAAKDAGVETKTYDLSGNPCELCMAIAAAQTGPIPMDQPFAKAGQTFAGVTLDRDVMFGSVHPQCSCGFTPVL